MGPNRMMGMPVADPPVLSHLLLEQPWPLVFALGVVGLVLRLVGQRRRDRRFTVAAIVAVSVAVAVLVLATVVTTDREWIFHRTERLIHSTAPLDISDLDRLIDARATLSGPDRSVWLRYDQIRTQLERVVDRWGVDGQGIRGLEVEVSRPNHGRSVFGLRTTLTQQGGMPVRSTWSLTWRKADDDQWRVTDIQWLEFQGQDPTNGIWN